MRRCYNAYAKDPDDFSHLNELHCAAFSFAEQSRTAGCVAVHRISGALATLVQELYHFPEQITSEVLTSIMQGIEFLTSMLKLRDVRNLRDPSTGLVCIVDDDAATRECLIMAMETVMLRTIDYQEPAKALCDLTDTSCDLIVLDVQMPGMDGFELCSEIRQRARHKDTPVVFVTGMSGPEMRARSTLCGGNDFLAKPFVLTELALKALMMIVRTELRTAV
jgi:PleD family two-component response regulator